MALNRTKRSANNHAPKYLNHRPSIPGVQTFENKSKNATQAWVNHKWRSIHNAILRLPTTLLDLQILGPLIPAARYVGRQWSTSRKYERNKNPTLWPTLGQPLHFSSPAPRTSGVYQDSMPSDPSFLMQGVLKLNHLKTNSNPSTVLVHSSAHPFVCLSVALVCSPRSLVRSPCLLVCSFVVISLFFLSPHPLVRSCRLVLS